MKRILGTALLSLGLLLAHAGDAEAALRGNPSSKVYHTETCKAAKNMKAPVAFGTEAEAKGKGFSPCLICFPDAAKKVQVSSSSPYVGNPKSKLFHKAGLPGNAEFGGEIAVHPGNDLNIHIHGESLTFYINRITQLSRKRKMIILHIKREAAKPSP